MDQLDSSNTSHTYDDSFISESGASINSPQPVNPRRASISSRRGSLPKAFSPLQTSRTTTNLTTPKPLLVDENEGEVVNSSVRIGDGEEHKMPREGEPSPSATEEMATIEDDFVSSSRPMTGIASSSYEPSPTDIAHFHSPPSTSSSSMPSHYNMTPPAYMNASSRFFASDHSYPPLPSHSERIESSSVDVSHFDGSYDMIHEPVPATANSSTQPSTADGSNFGDSSNRPPHNNSLHLDDSSDYSIGFRQVATLAAESGIRLEKIRSEPPNRPLDHPTTDSTSPTGLFQSQSNAGVSAASPYPTPSDELLDAEPFQDWEDDDVRSQQDDIQPLVDDDVRDHYDSGNDADPGHHHDTAADAAVTLLPTDAVAIVDKPHGYADDADVEELSKPTDHVDQEFHPNDDDAIHPYDGEQDQKYPTLLSSSLEPSSHDIVHPSSVASSAPISPNHAPTAFEIEDDFEDSIYHQQHPQQHYQHQSRNDDTAVQHQSSAVTHPIPAYVNSEPSDQSVPETKSNVSHTDRTEHTGTAPIPTHRQTPPEKPQSPALPSPSNRAIQLVSSHSIAPVAPTLSSAVSHSSRTQTATPPQSLVDAPSSHPFAPTHSKSPPIRLHTPLAASSSSIAVASSTIPVEKASTDSAIPLPAATPSHPAPTSPLQELLSFNLDVAVSRLMREHERALQLELKSSHRDEVTEAASLARPHRQVLHAQLPESHFPPAPQAAKSVGLPRSLQASKLTDPYLSRHTPIEIVRHRDSQEFRAPVVAPLAYSQPSASFTRATERLTKFLAAEDGVRRRTHEKATRELSRFATIDAKVKGTPPIYGDELVSSALSDYTNRQLRRNYSLNEKDLSSDLLPARHRYGRYEPLSSTPSYLSSSNDPSQAETRRIMTKLARREQNLIPSTLRRDENDSLIQPSSSSSSPSLSSSLRRSHFPSTTPLSSIPSFSSSSVPPVGLGISRYHQRVFDEKQRVCLLKLAHRHRLQAEEAIENTIKAAGQDGIIMESIHNETLAIEQALQRREAAERARMERADYDGHDVSEDLIRAPATSEEDGGFGSAFDRERLARIAIQRCLRDSDPSVSSSSHPLAAHEIEATILARGPDAEEEIQRYRQGQHHNYETQHYADPSAHHHIGYQRDDNEQKYDVTPAVSSSQPIDHYSTQFAPSVQPYPFELPASYSSDSTALEEGQITLPLSTLLHHPAMASSSHPAVSHQTAASNWSPGRIPLQNA